PNGAIVIIDHVVSTNNNYSFAYKTTINGELRIIAPTYGHNLGTVDGSGKLYMETGTMPAGNYTSFLDCTGDGTIEYGGNSDYTNIAGLYNTVPNLIFSGSGIRTLYDTDLTICKDLQINGPTLDNTSNNRKLTIGGSMELTAGHFWAGTGNAPAATVTFAGTSQQTIGNPGNFAGVDAFNNLEINNAAGLVIGTGATVEVNNKLLLTNGVITTAAANKLIVTNTSTAAITPTTGSSSSFIDGPLTKQIVNGDAFNFPIGKGTTLGNYFTLKSAAGATAYWTGEYMTPTIGSLTAPLLDINKFEYWRVKSTSTYNATVNINWDLQSNLYPGMTPNGMADMRVAHYNTGTSLWEMVGDLATTSTTGTITAGSVTNSTNVSIGTGGEDFTIGSVEIARPLARFASTADVCGTGTTIPVQISSTATIYPDYTLTYTINDGAPITTAPFSTLSYNLTTTTSGVYKLTEFTYKDAGAVTQNGFVGSGTVNNYDNPTIAAAGPDQPLCSLSGATLVANDPTVYDAQWSVVSGIGGVFVNNLLPGTTFTGNLGVAYNLRWTISNYTCTSSDDVLITFSIAAAKPSDFTSAQSVICTEGHSGRIYTVPNVSGVWYNWSYSGAGATFNAPTNTNSVVIDYDNTATSGTVSVTAENGCGQSAARTVAVTVSPRGGWVGDSGTLWSSTANWSCPGLPLITTPVTIASSAANQPLIDFAGAVCNTLDIGTGASLTISGNNYLDVYGDWTNNGSFNAANTSSINFKGTTAILGSSVNTFGNLVIASGALLTGPAGNMNILGDWTDNDAGAGFMPSTSTVTFSGSTPQTFTAPNAIKTFNNLDIANGSILNLPDNSKLTINGNLTNSGYLHILSTSSGTGSLITNGTITQTGTGFVEQAIKEQWHYHGLPIESVQNTFFNQKNFYYFDETVSDAWGANLSDFSTADMGWKIPVAGDLATNYGAAAGFAYFYYASNIGYTGKFNTGNKSVTLSYTNTPQLDIYDGWNLVGNPYVSAIDWNLVDKTNIDDAVYYYKDMTAGAPSTANYATYVGGISTNGGSRYVPQMQGFFIKAKDISTNGQALTFTNAMRVHPQPLEPLFYKKSELTNTSDFIKLNVGKNNVFDESVVLFNSEATNLHDSQFDAYKLFTKELLVPQLYSVGENDIMYAINTLTEFNEETEIPLGIRVGVSGEYAINVVETNITDKANIYLFDKKHNEFIQLYNSKEVNIYLEKGNHLNRFVIRFSKIAPTDENKEVYIYSSQQTVYVQSSNNEALQGEISVFDIAGKQIAHKPVAGEYLSSITTEAMQGIYLVQVKTNGKTILQKVMISN
ncbi:MAG TPA: hypothetical protein DCQ31_00310, partial [Bacteroidales bacterium]|nr:hypothetical protein [Bacteroidales bacterium]